MKRLAAFAAMGLMCLGFWALAVVTLAAYLDSPRIHP